MPFSELEAHAYTDGSSTGSRGPGGYSTAAPLFLWMYMLSKSCGSLLCARRGVWLGRGLRALGSAAFFPLCRGSTPCRSGRPLAGRVSR